MSGLTKGKCFSKVNRGQRKKSDFYQTPYSMTQQLLDVEFFHKEFPILEPAAGKGAIVKVLKDNNFQVFDSDIETGRDFFSHYAGVTNLITNPPYSLANKFILHAKKIVRNKIAMLLPLNYLQGQRRYESKLFRDPKFPLVRVHIFIRMSMLSDEIRQDGKYKTGMQAYAWFVWQKRSFFLSPTISWIDNREYVLRKGDKGCING